MIHSRFDFFLESHIEIGIWSNLYVHALSGITMSCRPISGYCASSVLQYTLKFMVWRKNAGEATINTLSYGLYSIDGRVLKGKIDIGEIEVMEHGVLIIGLISSWN